MRNVRHALASLRREQIVEAAVAVITEQGIQNLSLSEIEQRAGMSRGQLTYYFKAKEDILLAVFDRLVTLMHQRVGTPAGEGGSEASGWDWIRHLLESLLTRPPVGREFGCLQYTFLSQIGHREDFRQRLATLYDAWRSNMALGLGGDMACRQPAHSVSPRAMATLVQAILHGLAMQRAADPNAYDGEEMCRLCLDVLGSYLWGPPAREKKRPKAAKKTAAVPGSRSKGRPRDRSIAKGVSGERSS
jgi:AcrR family transcriptional regulator